MLVSRLTIALVALTLGAASARAEEAAKASPAGAAGRVMNLRDVSCNQYNDLADADRAPVVWFMAGYYRTVGVQARRFDLDLAGKGVSQVTEMCRTHPDASLRVTVENMFKPLLQQKKAAKGKKTS